MNICIALIAAVGFLAGTKVPENSVMKGADAFQGTWKLTAGEVDGTALTPEQLKVGKLVIQGNRFSVTLPEKGTATGTQKINATKSPKTIDVVDASGPNAGKKCLGIYEIKGDELRVCFAAAGKARPTEFASKPSGAQWVHVWTRVKSE
ncbi:MAG: TIGR03067 domain-containing protein [Pirellulales bacterium]|nr:TIGR03067 domain-containing protein [Pirellulales bacterium]